MSNEINDDQEWSKGRWDGGHELIPNSLLINDNLDPYDLNIFLLILSFHDRPDDYLTARELSLLTDISERQTNKSIKKLCKIEYIKEVKQAFTDGKTAPSIYIPILVARLSF